MYKNISIYNVSHKTSIESKNLRIRFNNINRFIVIYDGTRYLVSLGPEKDDTIYNRIRYLISLKKDITYTFSHYFPKIKVYSYDSLHIEKILALRSVKILLLYF